MALPAPPPSCAIATEHSTLMRRISRLEFVTINCINVSRFQCCSTSPLKDGAMRWVVVCRSERGCGQCAHHHRGRESCRVGHSTAAFLEGFCRLWARKSEPQLHCMTLACHTTEARMSHTRRQAAHNKQRTRCMCRRAPLTVLTPSAFVAFVDAARVASERRWVVSHDISLCPFGKHVCSRWRTARQRSQSCACLDLLATVQTTGANVTTLSL
jgi:hypothetical protein